MIGASSIGIRDFITLDMGGTSTDVCLVSDGDPLISRERNIGGWPVVCPSLDVHSVGTGGGSVLWIDDGGFLQVGPDSAGAVPGPACYNLGGVAPTVTDANLAARRLSPTRPLGGRLEVFRSWPSGPCVTAWPILWASPNLVRWTEHSWCSPATWSGRAYGVG